jgi:hypothetical protein
MRASVQMLTGGNWAKESPIMISCEAGLKTIETLSLLRSKSHRFRHFIVGLDIIELSLQE